MKKVVALMFVVSVALSCAVAFAQNGEWKDPPLLERGTSPKFRIPWVNEPEVVEHIRQAERDKLHPKSPLVIHKTVVVKKTNTVDDTARIMATQASGQAAMRWKLPSKPRRLLTPLPTKPTRLSKLPIMYHQRQNLPVKKQVKP